MHQHLTVSGRQAYRAASDRRARFERLYMRYYADILRFAWRRVGVDDAEDIVLETFTVAWRRLDEVPRAGELPWLYRVAGNVIRNNWRKARRDAVLAGMAKPSTEPDHAEAVSARRVAFEAFSALSDADQELLRLVAWEGLDAGQVATMLGCSRAVIYLRLHRLRTRLETSLDATSEKASRKGKR